MTYYVVELDPRNPNAGTVKAITDEPGVASSRAKLYGPNACAWMQPGPRDEDIRVGDRVWVRQDEPIERLD